MLRVLCLSLSMMCFVGPVAAETNDILDRLRLSQRQSWSAVFDWNKPTHVRACAISAVPVTGPVRSEKSKVQAFGLVTMSSGGSWRNRARFRLGYKPREQATYYVIIGRHKVAIERSGEFLIIDSPTMVDAILDALRTGHALVIAEQTFGNITAMEVYSPEGVDSAMQKVRSDCIF